MATTAAKKNTARKAAVKKPAAPKAKATAKGKATAARKSRATVNAGTCSVKGCSFPAKRRGLCSGKGSNNHYRKALRAERKTA